MTKWISKLLFLVVCTLYDSCTVSGWLTRPKQGPSLHTMDCLTATAEFGKRIPLCGYQGPRKRSGPLHHQKVRSMLLDIIVAKLRNRDNDLMDTNLNSDNYITNMNSNQMLNDHPSYWPSTDLNEVDEDFLNLIEDRSVDRENRYQKFADLFENIPMDYATGSDVIPLDSELYDAQHLLKMMQKQDSRNARIFRARRSLKNKRFAIKST